jgi:hypothetical protein
MLDAQHTQTEPGVHMRHPPMPFVVQRGGGGRLTRACVCMY